MGQVIFRDFWGSVIGRLAAYIWTSGMIFLETLSYLSTSQDHHSWRVQATWRGPWRHHVEIDQGELRQQVFEWCIILEEKSWFPATPWGCHGGQRWTTQPSSLHKTTSINVMVILSNWKTLKGREESVCACVYFKCSRKQIWKLFP